MEFLAVVFAVLSLFILMAAGYLLRRYAVFSDRHVHGISHILVNIALPALTVSSMQVSHEVVSVGMADIALCVAFACYIGSFLVAFLVCRSLPGTRSERGILEFMIVFPNVGFMGIPVAAVILGPGSLFYVILFNIPFNLLVFTLGVWLVSRTGGAVPSIRAILNPGLLASFIGLLFFILGFVIPWPASTALEWIGKTTTPLAMLVVGALLAVQPVAGLAGDRRVFAVTAVRLLVLPVLAFLLLPLFVGNRLLVMTSVLLMAMPVGATAVLLTEEYGADSALASKGVFVSTIASLATIPLVGVLLLS